MSAKKNHRRRNRSRRKPKLCEEARWINQTHKCRSDQCYFCDMRRKHKIKSKEPI